MSDNITQSENLLKQEEKTKDWLALLSKVSDALKNTYGWTRRNEEAGKKLAQLYKQEGGSFFGKTAIKQSLQIKDLTENIEKLDEAAVNFYKHNKFNKANEVLWEKRVLEVQKNRIELFQKVKQGAVDHIKSVTDISNVYKFYERRIDEANFSNRLFFSDLGKFGSDFTKHGDRLRNTTQGIKYALENTEKVAAQYGVTGEEVGAITKDLAFSMRQQIKPTKDMGKELIHYTKDILGASLAMGVKNEEMLEEYNFQIRDQGKSLDQVQGAVSDINTSQKLFQESLEKSGLAVKGSSAILKEDYWNILKQVKSEMPGLNKDNLALGATINAIAYYSKKSGASYNSMVEAMKATPKVLSGLPEFLKINIGSKLIEDWKTNKKKLLNETGLSEKEKTELGKRLEDIDKNITLPLEKEKAFEQAFSGTSVGIKKTFAGWKDLGTTLQQIKLKELLGDNYTARAAIGGMLDRGETGKAYEYLKKTKEKQKPEQKDFKKGLKGIGDKTRKMQDPMTYLAQTIQKADAVWKDITKSNYFLAATLVANTGGMLVNNSSTIAKLAGRIFGGGAASVARTIGANVAGAGAAGAGAAGAAGAGAGIGATLTGIGTSIAATAAAVVASPVFIPGAVGLGLALVGHLTKDKIIDHFIQKKIDKGKEKLKDYSKKVETSNLTEQLKSYIVASQRGLSSVSISKRDESGKAVTDAKGNIVYEKLQLDQANVKKYYERMAKYTGASIDQKELNNILSKLPKEVKKVTKLTSLPSQTSPSGSATPKQSTWGKAGSDVSKTPGERSDLPMDVRVDNTAKKINFTISTAEFTNAVAPSIAMYDKWRPRKR